MSRRGTMVLLTLAVTAGCASDAGEADGGVDGADPTIASLVGASAGEQFPEIVGAEATFDEGSDTWTFAVTVSFPYDTPERYADGWRVRGVDGTVYGVHTLTHDHAAEQPFTRRQSGVEIPSGVTEVTIEGRDQTNGFGGPTLTIELADR